jgi:hypothetical protein
LFGCRGPRSLRSARESQKKLVVFACTVATRTIQSKVPAHAGCEARKTPDRVSQEGPGESAPRPDKFRGAIRPPDDL